MTVPLVLVCMQLVASEVTAVVTVTTVGGLPDGHWANRLAARRPEMQARPADLRAAAATLLRSFIGIRVNCRVSSLQCLQPLLSLTGASRFKTNDPCAKLLIFALGLDHVQGEFLNLRQQLRLHVAWREFPTLTAQFFRKLLAGMELALPSRYIRKYNGKFTLLLDGNLLLTRGVRSWYIRN